MPKPTASRVLNVRTPGAGSPATDAADTVLETGGADEGEQVDRGLAPKPTAEQLNQMRDEAAALEASLLEDDDTGVAVEVVEPAAAPPAIAPDLQEFIKQQIADGIRQGLAMHRRAQASPSGTPAELPDESEVDAFSIRREVLTKQGFVVPVEYPGQRKPAGTNLG